MWPFAKKQRFPGIKQNPDGTIEFKLSNEEAQAADRALMAFKGMAVHQDAADKVRNGTIAVALSHYANDLVFMNCSIETTEAEDRANWPTIQKALKKAVAAVWKSYSLFPLPVFLYHRASFLAILGMRDEARKLFASFLIEQSKFKMDQIDKILFDYEGTDINRALSHAKKEA